MTIHYYFNLQTISRKFLHRFANRIKISKKKGLINIKENDQKCFLWCHVRHINPLKEHPERIQKIDRKISCNRNYDKI